MAWLPGPPTAHPTSARWFPLPSALSSPWPPSCSPSPPGPLPSVIEAMETCGEQPATGRERQVLEGVSPQIPGRQPQGRGPVVTLNQLWL